jgi:hypothetical protein
VTFNERSKDLEYSLSAHRSDLKLDTEFVDAFDKRVFELTDENILMEGEGAALQDPFCENLVGTDTGLEETVTRAAVPSMNFASLKATFNEHSKELEDSLLTHGPDLKPPVLTSWSWF